MMTLFANADRSSAPGNDRSRTDHDPVIVGQQNEHRTRLTINHLFPPGIDIGK